MKTKEVNLYISLHLTNLAKELLTQSLCNHTFEKFGHGYQCNTCDYYSGDNTTLNRLIKKSLKP